MTDSAQHYIELLSDDLYDLCEKSLLDLQEVREITKKMSTFENRLQRRISKKQDFLSYVSFLISLKTLLSLRKKRLGIEDKCHSADAMPIKKIHQVFARATKKFSADLDLWLEYIKHCIQFESTKVLSRVFGQALLLHPLEVKLWILASRFEMENQSNMPAARTLMHRALRIIPENEELWLEYFRLELLYLDKLNKRKEMMLGGKTMELSCYNDEDSSTAVNVENSLANSISIDVPELDDEKQSSLSSLPSSFLNTENLLQVIFDSAIEKFPSLSFAQRFLSIFEECNIFPAATCSYIQNTIKTTFKSNGDILIFALRQEWNTLEHTETNIVEIVHKYLKLIFDNNNTPCSKSILDLLRFIFSNSHLISRSQQSTILAVIFSSVQDHSVYDNEQIFTQWLNFLEGQNHWDEALRISNLSLQHIRSSPYLWEIRIRLSLITADNSSTDYLQNLSQLVNRALTDIPSYQSTSIRILYLQILDQLSQSNSSLFQKVADQCKFFLKDHSVEILDWFLVWNTKTYSIDSTRKSYTELKKNWLYAFSFLECIIKFEKSLEHQSKEIVCALYNELIRNAAEEQKLALWIEYTEWLIGDIKDFVEAAKVYSKAVDSLKNNGEERYEFIIAFNDLKSSSQ